MDFKLIICIAVAVSIVLLLIQWLASKNDVKKIYGYKIKKVKDKESGLTYFTLYVRNRNYLINKYYPVGEHITENTFGLVYFLHFKFNTVEDAEEYFGNNFNSLKR